MDWEPYSHRGNGVGKKGVVVEKLGQSVRIMTEPVPLNLELGDV